MYIFTCRMPVKSMLCAALWIYLIVAKQRLLLRVAIFVLCIWRLLCPCKTTKRIAERHGICRLHSLNFKVLAVWCRLFFKLRCHRVNYNSLITLLKTYCMYTVILQTYPSISPPHSQLFSALINTYEASYDSQKNTYVIRSWVDLAYSRDLIFITGWLTSCGNISNFHQGHMGPIRPC